MRETARPTQTSACPTQTERTAIFAPTTTSAHRLFARASNRTSRVDGCQDNARPRRRSAIHARSIINVAQAIATADGTHHEQTSACRTPMAGPVKSARTIISALRASVMDFTHREATGFRESASSSKTSSRQVDGPERYCQVNWRRMRSGCSWGILH